MTSSTHHTPAEDRHLLLAARAVAPNTSTAARDAQRSATSTRSGLHAASPDYVTVNALWQDPDRPDAASPSCSPR